MATKILVRPGLLKKFPDAERKLYQKAIAQFMEYHSHGANLEKLHSHQTAKNPLCSIRVNRSKRLILTPVKQNGTVTWLLVAVLDSHQYETLSKKNKSWLAVQIKNALEHDNDITTPTTEGTPTEEPGLPYFHEEHGIEFHNDQFFILDEHQQSAKLAPLPLLITGAPGSGKSSVALSLITQYAQNANKEGTRRVLYITQSEALTEHMKLEWEKIKEINSLDTQDYEVEFKTPQQLFDELHANSSADKPPALVGQNEFITWFSPFTEKELGVLKTARQSVRSKKNQESAEEILIRRLAKCPEHAYQEFRTLCGYQSFEEYNDSVGSKHSLFATVEERRWLWSIYQKYADHLTLNKKIDLFFNEIALQKHYDLVLADEAQDLSRKQLRSLSDMTPSAQIVYCIGDHQRIHDSRSIVPFIKSIFWAKPNKKEIHHLPLRASYRCPPKVVQLTNAVLQLQYHVTGGSPDKNELFYVTSSESVEKGSFHWLETNSDLAPLINDKNNADFVVITTPEFRAEAEALFGKERVFTPEEIKGLEYKHVLLYRILENERYKEATKIIEESFKLHNNFDEKQPIQKANNGSITHNVAFNELFVAITRSQSSVSIYQPEVRPIHRLRTLLKEFIVTNNQSKVHVQATPTHSSKEDWDARAAALRAQGQKEKADLIATRMSESTPEASSSAGPKKTSEPMIPQRKQTSSQKKESSDTLTRKNTAKTLLRQLISGDANSMKLLLEHPDAEELFFDTPISSVVPAFKNKYTLFEYIMSEETLRTNLATTLAVLINNFEKIKKSDPSEIQRIITILFRTVKLSGHSHAPPIFFYILSALNTTDETFLLLKKHTPQNVLNEFLDKPFKMPNENGTASLMHIAIKNNWKHVVKRLHLFDKLCADNGIPPQHLAIKYKQYGLLPVFKQLDIDLEQTDCHGVCLASAAVFSEDVLALSLLHRLGVRIDKPNTQGIKPCHRAAVFGNTEILLKLHELGADLTTPDMHGQTVRSIAEARKNVKMLAALDKIKSQINSLETDRNRFFSSGSVSPSAEPAKNALLAPKNLG